MAVLYVPLADKSAEAGLMRDKDPQDLLAAYNYRRARSVAGRLQLAGKTVPNVAIVGSTRPLGANAALDGADVDVVDLTNPGTVEERMHALRSSLESSGARPGEAGRPMVLQRLRQYFASVTSVTDDTSQTLTF
jgi:hypothetical protein